MNQANVFGAMILANENYKRAIEFRSPEWLPWSFIVNLDWIFEKNETKLECLKELQHQMPNEMLNLLPSAPSLYKQPVNQMEGMREWIDEWGTGWKDDGHGEKTDSYPLVDGYDGKYIIPDPYHPMRFVDCDKNLEVRGDLYVRGSVWATLFERLWMLRGFENMLMDPYLDETNFCKLRDRIVEFNLAVVDQLIRRKADAIFFCDDWGSQKALLMNPGDWRKFYKPSYKRMFERVRSGGAHVWMHLCGNITEILPDLIDIGLNVLNPVQPQAMDVKQLSKEFGGQVCFNGGVDVQGTMIHGFPGDVKREVRKLVEFFGKFNGGYIGGTSHSIMPETPLDNITALYEAFLEYS